MGAPESELDVEFEAMRQIFEALEPLEAQSRARVFDYIAARLEISRGSLSLPASSTAIARNNQDQQTDDQGDLSGNKFSSLAELYEAASPASDKDRVLVAAYWLQVCEGADSFVGLSVNKALKDLGYGVTNITNACAALKRQQPALVLQLKKSGTSKQARKTYKVTLAGIATVETMIGG